MKPIGYWVVAVSTQGDFMKWGRSGDCEYPFMSEVNAADQAKFISESNTHKDDFIFILKVFPNGQMVQYSYEGR